MTPNEIRDELAEKLWVDCHCWYVYDRNEGRSGTLQRRPKEDCPDCGGTGKRRPLRKPCDGWNSLESIVCLGCRKTPGIWTCHGEGHIYDSTLGVLEQAIRDKGWVVRYETFTHGDFVVVYGHRVELWEVFGQSDIGEAAGPEAVQLALLRAVEAEG